MLLNPAIIALLLGSALTAALLAYASWFAVRILIKWNLASGSELQLALERRTYLISTMLAYALGFELISLFLFVHTAEDLHSLFVGAMCAAGALYANPFGYPALVAKLALAVMAGAWLIVNHADNLCPDYPLIRVKYAWLLVMLPVSAASTALTWLYLTGLRADVITSCCGTLFSLGLPDVKEEITLSAPESYARYALYASAALSFGSGAYYYLRGRLGAVYAVSCLLMLTSGIAALIAVVSPYIYELPTHHCPFCMVQSDYDYIGYLIYALLIGGSAVGIGAGALGPLTRSMHLQDNGPALAVFKRRLTATSLALLAAFIAVAGYCVYSSNLVR